MVVKATEIVEYPLLPPVAGSRLQWHTSRLSCFALFVLAACEQVAVEFQALVDNGTQFILPENRFASLPAQPPREGDILYHAAQGLRHLLGLLRLHQQAVDAVGDDVLAAAHARCQA